MGDYWWLPVILGAIAASALIATGWLLGLDERSHRYQPRHDDEGWAARIAADLKASAGELEPGPGGLEAIQERLGHQTVAWPSLRDRFDSLFPGWRP